MGAILKINFQKNVRFLFFSSEDYYVQVIEMFQRHCFCAWYGIAKDRDARADYESNNFPRRLRRLLLAQTGVQGLYGRKLMD